MLNIARGLRQVHEAGYLHLDLKPNNVLVRDDGTPVLIDFGISKRSLVARYIEDKSFSMGSPYFMSPEQARGEVLDERSDIYSFGALWYRIFTGRTPYIGRSLPEILAAHEQDGTLDMGEALQRYQPILEHTLVGDREARYANAQELIENIEQHSFEATGRFVVPVGRFPPDQPRSGWSPRKPAAA